MKRKHLIVALLGVVSLGMTVPMAQSATISSSSKCSTLGATTKLKGIAYKCVIKGSSYFWEKQPVKKAPSKEVPATWYKAFAQPGILAETCSSNSDTNLLLLDSASGKTISKHSVPASMPTSNLGKVFFNLCNGPRPLDAASNLYIREQFNFDYSKIVFTSTEQKDGSIHVGYLDIATNKFTDITANSISNGFTATIPIDTNPLFDPKTGQLCYVRTPHISNSITSDTSSKANVIHCYDLTSNTDSTLGTLINFPGTDLDNDFLTIQNGIFVSGDHLVSPDSTAFTITAATVIGRVLFAPTLNGIASFAWDASKPLPNGSYFDSPYNSQYPTVYGWQDNSNLLVTFNSSSGIYLIPSSSVHELDATPKDLLPLNNAENSNFVSSPDGSKLAFIQSVNSNSNLYITSVTGSSSPTRILANFGARLIAWQ